MPQDKRTNAELELQAHLAEFDSLRRENDRILGERQQFILGALAATTALVGIALQNSQSVNGISERFYLIAPIGFTLLTWWYIRNNHTILTIELYTLKKLRPRIQKLAGEYAFTWIDFLWHSELSNSGRTIVLTQTASKFGLMQGGAFLSLIVFGFRTNWDLSHWEMVDWALIVINILGLVITVMLVLLTQKLLNQIRQIISTSV